MCKQAPLQFSDVTDKLILALKWKFRIELMQIEGKGAMWDQPAMSKCLLRLSLISQTPIPSWNDQFTLGILPIRPTQWKVFCYFPFFSFIFLGVFQPNYKKFRTRLFQATEHPQQLTTSDIIYDLMKIFLLALLSTSLFTCFSLWFPLKVCL